MSNLAQEEADRLFSQREQTTSHPEDADADADVDSEGDIDDEKPRSRIRAARTRPNRDSDDDEDYDSDTSPANMGTLSSTRSTYTIPSQVHHANTGPKGVIADAQSYHRARQSTFRRTLHSISNNLSFRPRTGTSEKPPALTHTSSTSDVEIPTDEDDDEFMTQWREQRLAELQGQYGLSTEERDQRSSQRSYGSLTPVNAQGYLTAIESSPAETTVIVLLYDPDRTSSQYKRSKEVESELEAIAYKYPWVRCVKLHHEIAEMESLDVPAVLAYRGGDVFATISGADAEGLEEVLLGQGIFVKR